VAIGIGDIARLFERYGAIAYEAEGVTQLEHALQTARHAEADGAGDALVTAALLHDLGHLLNRLGETPSARGLDDRHQYFAIPFLRGLFPPEVIEPVRLHVDAKRALCAIEPGYHDTLSADSRRSLELQGGMLGGVALERFLALDGAREALRLRRWDDAAKVPGAATPPLAHYLRIASRCAAGRG
jgi:phosphonate degradation associated HDIG domain protein